ncbi:exodeoxyribonuclease VII large subunit [uncultured Chitinophaga sp.]|jgi:Exonuclease VII, large subunit|uniref:exodeoxyribonuclease VII large subunit n=1 Tax=uncultured Chitinophaga sp. TaxID=339340 RepID=UPI002638EA80|nr:exodeoxyribonuclease VII large subunit [uncultured Chitinophaga sp.]
MSATPYIKLSDLSARIQQAIASAFAGQSYWVVADVTNYSFYQQRGYHYFDLVEKQDHAGDIIAKVAAVAWGTGANKIKDFERITGQLFKNGINVLVKVAVNYHQVYGLQITLLDIDANFTIGLLEQQKQEILNRLLAENPDFITRVGDRYLTRNNQLPLKPVLQQIAVVTSSNSAGYQDFIHTLHNNRFGYRFVVDNYFTVVQGEVNAEQVQQRFIDIFNSGKPYDAVVLIRGGGAQTDFLIFDTYRLGRTVARFPIPVITGIGHQKNETIVDMMAHTPTKTPTKAAEYIIAHNKAFEDGMVAMQQLILIRSQQLFSAHFQALSAIHTRIVNTSRDMLSTQKDVLAYYNQRMINTAREVLSNRQRALIGLSGQLLSRPQILVANKRNELSNQVANIRSFSRNYFQHKRMGIEHHDTVFKLVSPANILKRGFALVYHKGHITTNAVNIEPGSDISILLSDTALNATVTAKNKRNGTAGPDI